MARQKRPDASAQVQTWAAPRVTQTGTSALLFESPGPLSLESQQRIWAMALVLGARAGVRGAHPGMNNLLVRYDPLTICRDALHQAIEDAWLGVEPQLLAGRELVVQVVYGGEHGPDLIALCERSGLSPSEVARVHSEPDYTVFAPGNKGGFGYLFGLDERLFFPRKQSPVARRGGGHIAIGGMQCNLGSPASDRAERITGWNLIGQAPDAPPPFDLSRQPPTLTIPGDRIRFRIQKVIA